MTADEALFDRVFDKEGGLLSAVLPPDANYSGTIKNRYLQYMRGMQIDFPDMPLVFCDFILNQHINALVTKSQNKFLVGVNIGTHSILEDMFSKIFASRDLMTNIGRPEWEKPGWQLMDVSRSEDGLFINIPSVYPTPEIVDDVRFRYAHKYVDFAMEFLLAHEFAHIQRGHVGYMMSLSDTMYSEQHYNKDIIDKIGTLNCQAIEMDADRSAVAKAFDEAQHYMRLYKIKLDMFPLYESWETFIYHWTFAVYCLFSVFNHRPYDPQNLRLETHPSPSTRMQLITMWFISIITHTIKGETIDIMKIVDKACQEAENTLQKVLPQTGPKKTQLDVWGPLEGNNYLLELFAVFHELEPAIQPFSYALRK